MGKCPVEIRAEVWRRHSIRDVRQGRGDDFAGDCWINEHGDIRYTIVGFDLNASGNEAVRDSF